MGIANDNGQLLRQAREAAGLTQAELGDRLDPPVSKQKIYKLESGRDRISAVLAGQLAIILGLKPDDLADEAFIISNKLKLKPGQPGVRNLPVLGVAQAGNWAESETIDFGYDPDTGESFVPTVPVLAVDDFPARQQYALAIEGTSLNKVAPPGSFVICVRLESFPTDPDMRILDGKLVHVERRKGDLIETTVKRLKFRSNGAELWPESSDPKHQSAVLLRENGARTHVQIVGVVIGLYQEI